MKVMRLYTHWDASDAHAVIEFLDMLRDELWEHYGDQIVESMIDGENGYDSAQLSLPGLADDQDF